LERNKKGGGEKKVGSGRENRTCHEGHSKRNALRSGEEIKLLRQRKEKKHFNWDTSGARGMEGNVGEKQSSCTSRHDSRLDINRYCGKRTNERAER